jgi:hypothetical protein
MRCTDYRLVVMYKVAPSLKNLGGFKILHKVTINLASAIVVVIVILKL